jgi:hypothetical protein
LWRFRLFLDLVVFNDHIVVWSSGVDGEEGVM